jgi:hypothetical protein
MLCHGDWQMFTDVSENFDASSLKVKSSKVSGLLDPEAEGTNIFRNSGNY